VHPVILDTDVASLLHRRKLAGPLATRLIGLEPLTTFVTLGELTKWAEIRNWGALRRDGLMSWLSRIPVRPVTKRWPASGDACPPGDVIAVAGRSPSTTTVDRAGDLR
jgi:hypothetical protein